MADNPQFRTPRSDSQFFEEGIYPAQPVPNKFTDQALEFILDSHPSLVNDLKSSPLVSAARDEALEMLGRTTYNLSQALSEPDPRPITNYAAGTMPNGGAGRYHPFELSLVGEEESGDFVVGYRTSSETEFAPLDPQNLGGIIDHCSQFLRIHNNDDFAEELARLRNRQREEENYGAENGDGSSQDEPTVQAPPPIAEKVNGDADPDQNGVETGVYAHEVRTPTGPQEVAPGLLDAETGAIPITDEQAPEVFDDVDTQRIPIRDVQKPISEDAQIARRVGEVYRYLGDDQGLPNQEATGAILDIVTIVGNDVSPYSIAHVLKTDDYTTSHGNLVGPQVAEDGYRPQNVSAVDYMPMGYLKNSVRSRAQLHEKATAPDESDPSLTAVVEASSLEQTTFYEREQLEDDDLEVLQPEDPSGSYEPVDVELEEVNVPFGEYEPVPQGAPARQVYDAPRQQVPVQQPQVQSQTPRASARPQSPAQQDTGSSLWREAWDVFGPGLAIGALVIGGYFGYQHFQTNDEPAQITQEGSGAESSTYQIDGGNNDN